MSFTKSIGSEKSNHRWKISHCSNEVENKTFKIKETGSIWCISNVAVNFILMAIDSDLAKQYGRDNEDAELYCTILFPGRT